MSIITGKRVAVSAHFDSGTFLHFNVSNSQTKGYSDHETNIQTTYNLSFDDFTALSIMIESVINQYLTLKEHDNEEKTDT